MEHRSHFPTAAAQGVLLARGSVQSAAVKVLLFEIEYGLADLVGLLNDIIQRDHCKLLVSKIFFVVYSFQHENGRNHEKKTYTILATTGAGALKIILAGLSASSSLLSSALPRAEIPFLTHTSGYLNFGHFIANSSTVLERMQV